MADDDIRDLETRAALEAELEQLLYGQGWGDGSAELARELMARCSADEVAARMQEMREFAERNPGKVLRRAPPGTVDFASVQHARDLAEIDAAVEYEEAVVAQLTAVMDQSQLDHTSLITMTLRALLDALDCDAHGNIDRLTAIPKIADQLEVFMDFARKRNQLPPLSPNPRRI
ncbi:hypothetical protein [Bradyrhizobium sp. 27S5]|uniref:hypothetical protein n=1 Tax=Bradyrhizobium sp. 27S5 TaxID=3139728 RepID=UPI0030D225CE